MQRTGMSLWEFTLKGRKRLEEPIWKEFESPLIKPYFDIAVKAAINRIKCGINSDLALKRTHSTCNFAFSFPRVPCSQIDVCRTFLGDANLCDALPNPRDKAEKLQIFKATLELQNSWKRNDVNGGTSWLEIFRVHFIKRLTKALLEGETDVGYTIQERSTIDEPIDWNTEIGNDIPSRCIRVGGSRILKWHKKHHTVPQWRLAALGPDDELICVWTTVNWSSTYVNFDLEHVWFLLRFYKPKTNESSEDKERRTRIEEALQPRMQNEARTTPSEEPEKKRVKKEGEEVPDMPSGAQIKVEPDAQD